MSQDVIVKVIVLLTALVMLNRVLRGFTWFRLLKQKLHLVRPLKLDGAAKSSSCGGCESCPSSNP